MTQKIKTIFYLFFFLTILIVATYGISELTKNIQVTQSTKNLGLLGPLFLMIGISISGIFVPLTSLPFLIAGLSLFGFWETFIIYYLGNSIIAPVFDFWIARKWGRPAVAKLAGKASLHKIDDLAEEIGVKSLAILRIFGGILFDLISYAIGLTNINFRSYFILTSTLPIPGMLLTLYLINKGIKSNFLYLGIIVVWGYAAGILTSYIIYKNKKTII